MFSHIPSTSNVDEFSAAHSGSSQAAVSPDARHYTKKRGKTDKRRELVLGLCQTLAEGDEVDAFV